VAEELYRTLYREFEQAKFDSSETMQVLARLGAPAFAFRGFAWARRRAWASAAADLRAAAENFGEVDPLLVCICGAGLFAARQYDRAIATLARAATLAPPGDPSGVAQRARELAVKLTTALGWAQDARELRELSTSQPRSPEWRLQNEKREREQRHRVQQAIDCEPDEAAKRAYALLFRDGPDVASAVLDLLVHRFPEHPAVVGARLRLDLLLDRLELADQRCAALSNELSEQLRAEQAALALAWADGSTALQFTQDPGDDPQLLYLRALAIRLELNDFGEIVECLERARAQQPSSLPINLALAVIRHQHAPHRLDEDLHRRFTQLLDAAPGLLADAAASLGVELWTNLGPQSERELEAKILIRAQGMLTAERDLDIASYVRQGADARLHLRHVPTVRTSSSERSHLERLHHDDSALITSYEALLIRSIGVRPPAPQPPAPSTIEVVEPPADQDACAPGFLDAEQRERFLADGLLTLRGAFDPELARRWREDGLRRLREEPERWVRGYATKIADDPSRSLVNFSPDDPTTWTWPRIELLGPESLVIQEFAPAAWTAICQLLGGAERVQTRSWAQYLLLNLCDGQEGDDGLPAPDDAGWHIDDPSPVTRLDQIRNGLVCIALFDRLLPTSGNTWLALDSVALVARELAAHPEGIDFVNERGRRIPSRCARFHEVTGEAGDILFLHPLMMHTASSNSSGRIRWMANPMVYLQQPLDPFRPADQLSLVELAIARAITTQAS
jgi:tetratricopeptide (TPR) repeat protein